MRAGEEIFVAENTGLCPTLSVNTSWQWCGDDDDDDDREKEDE